MSKIGVGIGEEFPADDSKIQEAPRKTCDYGCATDEEHAARRRAWRKWREQRRQWHRKWRKEWRERNRAFQRNWRENVERNIHDNIQRSILDNIAEHTGDTFRGEQSGIARPAEWRPILWAVLGLLAAVALVSFVFSSIYVVVGVVALLALIASYYRGDPFAFEPSPSAEAAH